MQTTSIGSLLIIAIAALIVLGLAVFAWLFLSPGDESGIFPPEEGPAANAPDSGLAPTIDILDRGDRPDEMSPADEDAAAREAITHTGLYIAGRVTDEATGEPVKGFHVWLRRQRFEDPDDPERRTGWKRIFEEDVHDEEGRFHINLDEGGLFRMRVSSPRHLQRRLDDFTVTAEQGPADLEIALDPGLTVTGRVVDDSTEEPVADALIGTTGGPRGEIRRSTDFEVVRTGNPMSQIHAWSDADGRFRLGGLNDKRQKIAADHPDYAEGWADVTPSEDVEIEIRLGGGSRVFGTVMDDAGNPCPGVTVRCYGNDIPLERSVVSGPTGTYRTDPVPAGWIELNAFQRDVSDAERTFSEEWKYALVKDNDVEVNFGPSPDYVTWQGAVYGHDGLPLSGGSIHTLFGAPQEVQGHRPRMGNFRFAEIDEEGRFALSKLYPGSYLVSLLFAEGTWYDDQITVHLAEPGVVVKDIRLAPRDVQGTGIVRGVVIDGATGLPLAIQARSHIFAYLINRSPPFKSHSDNINEQGRFEFLHIPPGVYTLIIHGKGLPPPSRQDIQVEPDQVIEDVRVTIPAGGRLFARVTGFSGEDPRSIDLVLTPEQGRLREFGGSRIDANGSWEQTYDLGAGPWTADFTAEGIGGVHRQFRIEAGRTTELFVRRDEFVAFEGTLTLTGTVTMADGIPVRGKRLSFFAKGVHGLTSGGEQINGRTDDDGRFSLPGFRPGQWWVRAMLERGIQPAFRDIIIPPNPGDPYTVDLVIPGGTVSGRLYDGLTGNELSSDGPKWWIFLTDLDNETLVCEIQGGQTGSSFELRGIPACRFNMNISARGYFRYVTPEMVHPGTGKVDAGKILLKPSGILEIEVRDIDGNSPAGFKLYVNDQEIWNRQELEEGIHYYDKLPTGPATVAVTAVGYKAHEAEVNLKPGAPVRLDVVLEKM